MQATEGCIKQTKLGSSRKMLKSGSPKVLWNHCIEPEALICSHTALNIYGLEGQVPETLMSGQTDDISNLCEFEWFQWVMFSQPTETYPEDKLFVVGWLGPAIDVGTAMTDKCLLPNGGYVCRSTMRPWTPVEEDDPVWLAERVSFME